MNTNTTDAPNITIDMDGPNGPRIVFPYQSIADDVDAAAPEGWVVSWGTVIADTSDGRRALPLVRPSLADAYVAAHAAMVAADVLDDATPCTCDERDPSVAHSTCPGCDARIAYHAADRLCDAARAAWLASAENRAWATGGDSWGGGPGDTIEDMPPSEIEAELERGARGGNWTVEDGTIWIHDIASPIDPATGKAIESERVRVTTAIHPPTPRCTDGSKRHTWRVERTTGHGGGVIVTEVCTACDWRKVTDTWAQDRSTGEQGLTSIRYEDSAHAGEGY